MAEMMEPAVAPAGAGREFAPPPRFAAATFASYLPGDPSQARALERVTRLVAGVQVPPARRGFPLFRARPAQIRGLYLDGAFGVGKTHLLAAAWHAAAAVPRAYLSFQELVHVVGARGLVRAKDDFAAIRLLCLDEFELDDPGNTLIVKSFLESLFERGATVITTSNTPAQAQGEGRFNTRDFRREIQGIADRFEPVRLVGPDYRARAGVVLAPTGRLELPEAAREPLVAAEWHELMVVLRRHHPADYAALAAGIGTLVVQEAETMATQADALRFVHFIDRLYDRGAGLHLSLASGTGSDPRALFDPSYRESAYHKKHDRCVSRLGELLSEAGLA